MIRFSNLLALKPVGGLIGVSVLVFFACSCPAPVIRDLQATQHTELQVGLDAEPQAVPVVRMARNEWRWRAQPIALVSPDGEAALTTGPLGTLIQWSPITGRESFTFEHDDRPILHAAFSPMHKLLATTANDGQVIVRDRNTGERVLTLEGHQGRAGIESALQFSPNGRRLVSFGEDDWYLRVYDVHLGELLHKHPIRPSRMQLMENDDGRAYTPTGAFRFVTASAVFTPDAQTMILQIGDAIYWFDVETGVETRLVEVEHRANAEDSLVISHDGARLAFVTYTGAGSSSRQRERHIEFRDAQTAELERTIRIVSEARAVAVFSPDDSLIVVALGDDGLYVYDVATGRKLAQIDNELAPASAAAFTPDGERIVSAYADGSAVVWDWQEFAIER